jgi:hypothetical protein
MKTNISDKLINLKYIIKPKLKTNIYSSPQSLIDELNKYDFNFIQIIVPYFPPELPNNNFTVGKYINMKKKHYIYMNINNKMYFATSNI